MVPPTTDLSPTALNCLAGSEGTRGKVPVVAAGWRSPIGVPNLVEVLEGYSRAGAIQRFDQLTSQVFHGCPSTAKSSTSTGIGQTQVLVMPQVGDESVAVEAATTGDTTSTVVISRTKGTIVYLVYETHGPPDTSLLQLVSNPPRPRRRQDDRADAQTVTGRPQGYIWVTRRVSGWHRSLGRAADQGNPLTMTGRGRTIHDLVPARSCRTQDPGCSAGIFGISPGHAT